MYEQYKVTFNTMIKRPSRLQRKVKHARDSTERTQANTCLDEGRNLPFSATQSTTW